MIEHAFSNLLPLLLPGVAIILLMKASGLYWPTISGWLGERKVRSSLAGLSSGDGYLVLHDLLLPCEDGETTQIDHVVCAPSGIFVIETKNHDGYIYGKAGDAQWTQVFNSRSKFSFQNPIFQNVRHIEAVRSFITGVPVHNIVVFVRGHFPEGMPRGVFTPEEMTSHIRSFEGVENHLDSQQAGQKLLAAALTSPEARKAHVLRLQERHGGRWRLLLAHAMAIGAMVLLAGTFLSGTGEKEVRAITPKPRFPIPQEQAGRPATPVKPSVKPASTQIRVVAMGNNRAAIIENGEIVTLNTGQTSPGGWRLSSASTRHAILISPDGKRFAFGSPPLQGE